MTYFFILLLLNLKDTIAISPSGDAELNLIVFNLRFNETYSNKNFLFTIKK